MSHSCSTWSTLWNLIHIHSTVSDFVCIWHAFHILTTSRGTSTNSLSLATHIISHEELLLIVLRHLLHRLYLLLHSHHRVSSLGHMFLFHSFLCGLMICLFDHIMIADWSYTTSHIRRLVVLCLLSILHHKWILTNRCLIVLSHDCCGQSFIRYIKMLASQEAI
jgi:hypothetical protein